MHFSLPGDRLYQLAQARPHNVLHFLVLTCFMTMQPHLSTGAPPSDDIPVERNPVYGAGPQPPTAATVGGGWQQNNDGEYEPLN